MMHPFVEGLDWLLSFYVNARGWFWLCVLVIVIAAASRSRLAFLRRAGRHRFRSFGLARDALVRDCLKGIKRGPAEWARGVRCLHGPHRNLGPRANEDSSSHSQQVHLQSQVTVHDELISCRWSHALPSDR